MDILKKDIQYIKGVGPKRKYLLNKLKIYSVEDMVFHFPRKYENRSLVKKISEVKLNEKSTIEGRISGKCQTINVRRGMNINKYLVKDSTGFINITFFNQPYMRDKFKPDDYIMFNGRVKMGHQGLEMINPAFEIISGQERTTLDAVVPIYPSTKGLSQNQIIKIKKNILEMVLDSIVDYMPRDIIKRNKLCSINFALEKIHFPKSLNELKVAKYRLVFDELLLLQLTLMRIKQRMISYNNAIILENNKGLSDFIKRLPFTLTGAQEGVLNEIINDLENSIPMNRLVQGDVGSGKTIVAIIVLYKTIINGCQGAFMAPTEILAEQHYSSLRQLLEPMGVRIGLLTGSLARNKKLELIKEIREGKIDIVIGTHALIQEEVSFKCLALVITDEQHRFGVRQRAILAEKGKNPHVLVMTATPIPRTLALILYGDLDISIIDKLPPGRKEIKTYSLYSQERDKAYAFAQKQLQLGRQIYVVCPLIDETENIEAKGAMEIYQELASTYFANYKVGLLHGKMKANEKDYIMKQFLDNKINVLVATTVIEVGVNVPNASLMIIKNAERFGLAQLHQLRGRVGRGHSQSYCILLHNNKSKVARERIKIMESTNDGFIISEKDLQIRGPGEFLGLRQHGLPELKIANLFKHVKILKRVQLQIEDLLKNDFYLSLPENMLLNERLNEKLKDFEGL